MAVYKVIQDIEAEDKLVGPLTLKGLGYAGIAAILAYLNVRLLMSGAPIVIKVPFSILFLMPMLLFGLLASPIGRDQPTEVWLLSRVRFFLKSRQRIWDQSETNNLVTITVPKKPERKLVKDISQTEVHSRLKALAMTLDSRGWAVKNVNVNLSSHPGYLDSDKDGSDRLIAAPSLPSTSVMADVQAADDILDEQNNPTARKFNNLMIQADTKRRQAIADKINSARDGSEEPEQAVDFSFIDKFGATPGDRTSFVTTTIIKPGQKTSGKKPTVSQEEQSLLEKIHQKEEQIHSMVAREGERFRRKTNPQPAQPRNITPKSGSSSTSVTDATQADKLELAQSGNDLSVASIASLANRKNQAEQTGPNEVTISFH